MSCPLRVLVACEYSGRVRQAFRNLGHEAWSCDLLDAEDGSPYHFKGDCFAQIHGAWLDDDGWDLLIAHPPCTYLARSGMRWLKDQLPLKSGKPVGAERRQLLAESLEFFQRLLNAPVPHIAVENPRSFLIPTPATQYIQPWQFGHGEVKETGLWLKNLPPLMTTNIVEGREGRVWKLPPSPNRWKERSRTYEGIAAAMADQWSRFILEQRRLAA